MARTFQEKSDGNFSLYQAGFWVEHDVGDSVWASLEPLLLKSRTDWTLFRQLSYIMRVPDLSSSDFKVCWLCALKATNRRQSWVECVYEPLQ
jgi:hypothetical protein